jgi:hypothetical protein
MSMKTKKRLFVGAALVAALGRPEGLRAFARRAIAPHPTLQRRRVIIRLKAES